MNTRNLAGVGLWLTLACGMVAGCAMPKISGQTSAQAATEVSTATACENYAGALNALAIARAAGKLSTQAVKAIEQTEAPVNAICLAPTPPAGAAQTVQAATAALTAYAKGAK